MPVYGDGTERVVPPLGFPDFLCTLEVLLGLGQCMYNASFIKRQGCQPSALAHVSAEPQPPFGFGCAGWGPVASSVVEVSWRGFQPHLAHKKVPYDVTLCV